MKKILLISGIVILTAVALFLALNSYIYNEKQGNGEPTDPYRGTLSGMQTCLPHKDTSGPVTLECAIGFRTDAGEYYALDFSLLSAEMPALTDGTRFTATGLITPIENLSSDHWQKYDVVGIFSVTDSVTIENPVTEPEEPNTPAAGPCYVGGCSGQICSDEEVAASDCMYQEEYACYQNATCERQGSGLCGWTETPALTQCLKSTPSDLQ